MDFFDELNDKIKHSNEDESKLKRQRERNELLEEIRSSFNELEKEATQKGNRLRFGNPANGTDNAWAGSYNGETVIVFTDDVFRRRHDDKNLSVIDAIKQIIKHQIK